MIVYHGSTTEVKNPDTQHSYRNLDFGKGFYVTTVREQAERWAKRKADLSGNGNGVISVYEMPDDHEGFRTLDFAEDMDSWIDFVCACRDGDTGYLEYDIIIGKVANDKVYRVVDMYRRGIWDKQRALSEMKVYETYDQIAFITQDAIDSCLSFVESFEV